MWLIRLIALVLITDTSRALQCYKCTNFQVDSTDPFIQQTFAGKTDPDCEHVSFLKPDKFKQCPNDGNNYRCAFVTSQVVASIRFPGQSINFTIQARDCLYTTATDGCHVNEYGEGRTLIVEALQSVPVFNAQLYGLTDCYCSTDICDAGPCASGSLSIYNYCVPWYWIAGASGIILLTCLLITCCCCCCSCCRCCCCDCCCCRRRETHGYVIQRNVPLPPIVHIATNSSGMTYSVEDPNPPDYDYSYGGDQRVLIAPGKHN